MRRVIAGAIGGTLATVPMTVVMSGLFHRLPQSLRYPLPPREITQDVVARAGLADKLRDRQLTGLSLGAHFAYGAATGALYGWLLTRSTSASRAVTRGAGYGIAVWGGSYLGWIPAARILRPATQHPAPRRRLMLAAHLVWGAATGCLTHCLVSRPAREKQARQ